MKIYNETRPRWASALVFLALVVGLVSQGRGQTWATNSPLKSARWAHTATLLGNGSILISGGTIYNVSGNYADTNGCELYNPATGTSALTASMQSHRSSHTATRLLDGRVLVAGGGSGDSEIYDPASNTWGGVATLQEERVVATATLLPNGKVLLASGYNDNNGQEISSAELFDPSLGTWTATGSLPFAGDTAAAALLNNGKVLLCGGYDGLGNSLTNAALYNPATGTWTAIAGMHEGRSGHTATRLGDGRILVEGGGGANSVEVYDPVGGTWSYLAPMNDGRYYPRAQLLTNGQVMVIGDGITDVELYDPANDVWNFANPLPVPGHLQTITLLAGGQVVVTGGSESDYNGPPISVVETFGVSVLSPSLAVTNTPVIGALPLLVQFTSPGLDSSGNTVTNWSWNFGDGAVSVAQSPSHTYTNFGTFSPSLVAYSTFGTTPLAVTGPNSVTVTNHFITVSDTPSSGPLPLTVQFTSPGVDSGGNTVTNWNWAFGDGGTSTVQSPSHVFAVAGSYSPSLTARSTYGKLPLDVFGLGGITVTNTPNPNFKTLYTFTPSFGTGPNPGLLLADGTLYGTAGHGGSNNWGTIFALKPDGTGFTNLYHFDLNTHGGAPSGALILSGATLYGSAGLGGTLGGGTLFAINTNGTGFTNLYLFKLNLPNTGNGPLSGLALAGNTLYGTTEFGGTFDHGTVYGKATDSTNFYDLHNFSTPFGPNFNQNGDGLLLIQKPIFFGGTLYGMALNGGNGYGTVFAVDTNNPASFRALHLFSVPTSSTNSDGASPFAGLVLSGNMLYGTTGYGGTRSNGVIFAVNTNGTGFTNLYNFTGGNDGGNPNGELTVSNGVLYGATPVGGTATNGTLFSIHTDGTGFKTLYNFNGGSDGTSPGGNLVLSGNTLYGTASGGSGDGVIYSFVIAQPPLLAIRVAGTNVVLTWTNTSTGFTLQSTPQISPTSWTTVIPSPAVIGGNYTVTNGIPPLQKFYRLMQ